MINRNLNISLETKFPINTSADKENINPAESIQKINQNRLKIEKAQSPIIPFINGRKLQKLLDKPFPYEALINYQVNQVRKVKAVYPREIKAKIIKN